ncbi:MAG: hypothetical protein ACETVW_02160, partial [Dehalococcoidia bacterium]
PDLLRARKALSQLSYSPKNSQLLYQIIVQRGNFQYMADYAAKGKPAMRKSGGNWQPSLGFMIVYVNDNI